MSRLNFEFGLRQGGTLCRCVAPLAVGDLRDEECLDGELALRRCMTVCRSDVTIGANKTSPHALTEHDLAKIVGGANQERLYTYALISSLCCD